jgi:tRNA 2-thiouridine synthesizing protein E
MGEALDSLGKKIDFDPDGFMKNPDLWDDAVASAIATEDGIDEMTDKHWAVVRFIREYWLEHDLAPTVRLLCKESRVGVREMYKLFTAGPARGACRIAGLPKPDGCV